MTKNNKTTAKRAKRRRNKQTNNNNVNNQPNAGVVGRPTFAPGAYGITLSPSTYSMTSSSNGLQVRIRGRDILGPCQYNGGTSAVFGVFDLNPACWNNSRLSLVAKTYEKYRYDHMTLHYIPSVATSTAGTTAVYFEPEVYDNVVNSVSAALTHHDSIAGPIWGPLCVQYRRAPGDQTTYLCTEKSGIERGLLSQAKAAVICETAATAIGYLAIEYDITFMYPELEYGYTGEQYVSTSATLTAAANGVIATVPTWTSVTQKVVEIVVGNAILACYVNNVSNTYDYVAGSLLYSAWDGTSWRLYPDLASALSKSGPLSSVAAIAGVVYAYYMRRLVFGS